MTEAHLTAVGSAAWPLLMAEDLRKAYGSRHALRGLSFSLWPGRILGFLGPNGAGKTTAIRILTTSIEATSGYFIVDGVGSDHPDRVRSKIGVLPENLGFPKHMTGLEYLVYFGRLYGLSATAARERAVGLLADVGLQQRATHRIGGYSRGMRQRLGIARALINDPLVVFLDEPTLGLDPRGQQELLELIQRIARERNASVVLCSHQLPEIEGICDDVVILNLGQVVASGTVAEVLGETGGRSIKVRVPAASVEEAVRILQGRPGVESVSVADEANGRLSVEVSEGGDSDEALRTRNELADTLIHAGIPIISFGFAGNRLQDLFLELTDEAIA